VRHPSVGLRQTLHVFDWGVVGVRVVCDGDGSVIDVIDVGVGDEALDIEVTTVDGVCVCVCVCVCLSLGEGTHVDC
jgi:hypothetical protein